MLSIAALYEIFGKEFAEFLREDFDTTEQDRAELEAAGLPPRSETEVHQPQLVVYSLLINLILHLMKN